MIAEVLHAVPDRVFECIYAAPMVLAAGGAFVVGLGAAGRAAGWSPQCAACGFDLRATPADVAACPECGKLLSGGRAVRYGKRSRRWGVAAVGLVVLGCGVAAEQTSAPANVLAWRDNVIASAVPLDALLDELAAGDASAAHEVLAELSGSGRRARAGAYKRASDPGPVDVVLSRMERDRAVRDALLIGLLRPQVCYVLSSQGREPCTRVLSLVAAAMKESPDLAGRLAGSELIGLKMSAGQGGRDAFAELLQDGEFVRSLYTANVMPGTVVDGARVPVYVQPELGQAWLAALFRDDLFTGVRSARWRPVGGSEADWKPVARPTSRLPRQGAQRELILVGPLHADAIEVEAECVVITGVNAEIWTRRNVASSTDLLPEEGIEVRWRKEYEVRSRDSLKLAPADGPLVPALEGQAVGSLTVERVGQSDSYRLSDASPRVEADGILFCIRAWLLQRDKRWEFRMSGTAPLAQMLVEAPGFDPTKPCAVEIHPDMDGLRAMAQRDASYLNLHRLLEYPRSGVEPLRLKVIDPR